MRVNVCVGFHISNNISLHIGGYVGYRGSINTRGSEQQDWYVDERRESLESSLYKNDYGLVEQVQTQFPLNKYFDFIGRLELSQGLMNIWHPTTVNPPDIYYMNIQTSLSVGLRYNFQ